MGYRSMKVIFIVSVLLPHPKFDETNAYNMHSKDLDIRLLEAFTECAHLYFFILHVVWENLKYCATWMSDYVATGSDRLIPLLKGAVLHA